MSHDSDLSVPTFYLRAKTSEVFLDDEGCDTVLGLLAGREHESGFVNLYVGA